MPDKLSMSDIMDMFNGPKTSVKGIEILNTYGNTHNLKFTEQDLEDIVTLGNENIESGVAIPNLKVSHSSEQLILKELLETVPEEYEELPVLGLLSNLRKVGKSILADVNEIPVKLKEILFSGKYFRAISPEIVLNWRETGKYFIKAISLTNKPSLKHIADVHLSEALMFDGNLIIEEGVMTPEELALKKKADENKKKEELVLSDGLVQKLSEKLGLKDLFKKKDELGNDDDDKKKKKDDNLVPLSEVVNLKEDFENQLNELKKKLVDKDKDQEKFFNDLERIKKETREKNGEAICDKAMNSGVPKIIVDYFRPILLQEVGATEVLLSEKVDDELVEVKRPLSEVVEGLFKIYPDKVDFSDRTSTNLSVTQDEGKKKQINAKVKELVSEGMTKHEALMQAGEELA